MTLYIEFYIFQLYLCTFKNEINKISSQFGITGE